MKLRIFVALTVLLTATAAFAGEQARVTIPFSFQAQDQVFPAGQYVISYGSQWQGVTLQEVHGKAFAYVPISALREPVSKNGKLVFNVYGDNYFLRQILIPGVVGADLFRSKAERRQMAPKTLAKAEVTVPATN